MTKKVLSVFTIFALIIIPIIVFILSRLSPSEKAIIVTPIEDVAQAVEKIGENPLGKIARESLFAEAEEYGVFIKNLETKETYLYNENKKFDSASLYKLWVMGVAYQKIKDGQLSEDEILRGDLGILSEILLIATPSASPSPNEPNSSEQKTLEISYVAKDAIEKMITASDNFAALLIASRSGSFAVTNFLKNYDFYDSSFRSPPSTTAKDIGLFFEKIYKGEMVDAKYSEKMLEILKRQTLNDRIPKYLPKGIMVAHKTGELDGFKHDAGIVFSPDGDYIIVVLSKTKNPSAAAEKIAKFSKEVYDYFQKN